MGGEASSTLELHESWALWAGRLPASHWKARPRIWMREAGLLQHPPIVGGLHNETDRRCRCSSSHNELFAPNNTSTHCRSISFKAMTEELLRQLSFSYYVCTTAEQPTKQRSLHYVLYWEKMLRYYLGMFIYALSFRTFYLTYVLVAELTESFVFRTCQKIQPALPKCART